MEKNELRQALRAYFKDAGGFLPADGDNLFEKGALDSFGVVDFLTFLESRFNVRIQIEDLNEANFSTVESVADLIAKYGGG
jgi:acyl carrier protein